MIKKILSSLVISILVILCFSLIYTIDSKTKKPEIIINPQNEVVNLDPKILQLLSLGQQRMMSSALWVQTMFKSDLLHHKERSLKNWMYLRVNAITDLTPYFYKAYSIGAQYLSIIKDDDLGAKKIYDKGLLIFPKNYQLLYGAGFHYFYELGESEKASKLFERSIQYGNKMAFLPSLVARIKANSGDLYAAKKLIIENIKALEKSSPLKRRLRLSLHSVQVEIDLKCLNSKNLKNKECHLKDPYGNFYKKKGNIYVAPKKWKKFRLNTNKV